MYSARVFQGKNGSEIRIRLALPEDYDKTIADFSAVAAERIYLNTETVRPDTKKIWTERWVENGEKDLFAVAEVNGNIVGGVVLNMYSTSPKTDHVRELGMWIIREYREIGVGNAMMQYAIQWAKSRNFIHKITLGVWSTNSRAISLYLKHGFHIDGSHVNMAMINGSYADEILMSLDF